MKEHSDLRGIASMLVATAVFVIGDGFMKLALAELPPFEVLFLRGVAASLTGAVVLSLRNEWRFLPELRSGHTLLRAVCETAGTLCFIVALSRMPIADTTAILQTAPLFLIVGTAIVFRERIGVERIALLLVGFAGALMVAQPARGGLSAAALPAFGCALLIAVRDLLGRKVPDQLPVTVVVFAAVLMVTLASGLMSLGFETWVTPTGVHLVSLSVAGLLVTVGHSGLFLAYRLGRTAVIAPFFYSLVFWSVVAGWLIWGQLPSPLALVGIALIGVSGICIVMLDQRQTLRRLANG